MAEAKWDEEREAAAIVARFLGARSVTKHDDGTSPGMHDFELLLDDRVVALEVTSIADEDALGLWAAVRKRTLAAPSLSRVWGLGLRDSRVRIDPVFETGVSRLEVLEANGIDAFDHSPPLATWPNEAKAALANLRGLGVMTGASEAGGDDGGRIFLGVVGTGIWSHSSDLNDALHPAIEHNIDKLRAAAADERHLFVWLTWTSHESQAALLYLQNLGQLPESDPDLLPQGLDVLWACPERMMPDRGRPLLRATHTGWEVVSSV